MALPALIAHRGYTLHYPENTLASVEAALAAGARFIEVDVQLTRDRVPVLFHDDSLTRLCGVEGVVHDYPLPRLKELRASDFGRFGYRFANERIATLAELAAVLKANPGVIAFVELKTAALDRFGIDTVLEQVRRDLTPVIARCVLISYALPALAAARAAGWPRVGAVVDDWRERDRLELRALRPHYLFCDVAGLPRFGRLAHPDARIAVFEVADAALALKLAARGADMIETFAFGELARELELLAAEA